MRSLLIAATFALLTVAHSNVNAQTESKAETQIGGALYSAIPSRWGAAFEAGKYWKVGSESKIGVGVEIGLFAREDPGQKSPFSLFTAFPITLITPAGIGVTAGVGVSQEVERKVFMWEAGAIIAVGNNYLKLGYNSTKRAILGMRWPV